MTEKLPSIDDFYEELPSVDELITEEKLPSVDEFIEPPRPEEEIADAIRQGDEEKPVDTGPCSIEEQYTEFVRLVNDVREDIPEIPEIKYYDEQIAELSTTMEEIRESIPEVPEQITYDEEITAICSLIDELKEEVRTNAAEIPEIRYYDDQIERLESSLKSLPEIRHYEGDLTSIRDEIVLIKESIPVFPKWVNEVNEVPDFSWIGKQFSVIDDDFIKVADNANSIRDRITEEVRQLSEDLETKRFESKTEINELTQNFKEVKEKIYEELRTAAVGILDIKHAFKNDDRLMKKQIMSKYNLLKLNVEEQIEKFNKTNEDTKDLYAGYFESLTEEISNLPKVKYYEEDIKNVREEFSKGLDSLKILVEDIRQKQKLTKDEIETIQEGLLNEPPEKTQSVGTGDDPLAPLDKQFPNLKALADHYRLFINRTQQQLAVIGGGGAGFIKDLSDVSIGASPDTGSLLIYDGDNWVGIASTALDKSSTLHEALTQGNVSGIGMSVGVITATSGFFSGILTASQLNYDVVTDIYSTGIVTATKGIQQTGSEGLHVTAGVSTFVGLSSFLNGVNVKAGSATTALIVQGDARITGILTIGTGSVTINGDDNKVKIGVGVTLTSTGEADFVGVVTAKGFRVGSAATISSNGNATFSGIVTSSRFTGPLTGNVTGDASGNAGTATALETARNIGGVSFDGSANINLPGVNEAGNQNTSGTAAGLTGNPTITVTKVNVGTAATIAANGNISAAGIVTASSFVGNGANITAISGSNIASGTVAAARVATLNQDTTGNAATATILETARTIGGVSFNGSAAINLPGVNEAGNQNTSGTAAGLSGNPTITVTKVNVGTAATISANGNATFAGIVTATSFTGDGTGLTGVASTDNIQTGTPATFLSNVNITGVTTATGGLNVGTAATIFANGNIAAGIVTASSFVGDGSGLSGVGATEEDTAVSSTSATTVLSFAKASYRAAFIKLTITQGSNYQSGKYSLIHDGTTVTVVEENAIATNSTLGTLSGTISGDNVLFQVTMGSSSSATVTLIKELITV
jgi:hypothetical protein